MKRLIFVLCFVTAVTGSRAQTPQPGVHVIDQSDFRSLGITRLHDVFWLVNGGRVTTVDDFTYGAALGGLGRPDRSQWSMTLDGEPLELAIWNVHNIDLATVPLVDIDSVRVRSTPTIKGGVPVRGAVEVWTRPIPDGLSSSATVLAINEAGDPGPFRYSRPELRVANVDKSGPDGSLSFGYGGRRWAVRLTGAWLQHIPSDVAAFRRNRVAFDEPTTPEMVAQTLRFEVRGESRVGSHFAAGSYQTFDDMMFLNELTREIPVRYRRVQATYRQRSGIGNRSARVSAALVVNDLQNDTRANRVPVDWLERRVRFSVGLDAAPQLEVEATGNFVSVSSDQSSLDDSRYSILTLAGRSEMPTGYVEFGVSTDGDALGVHVSGTKSHRVGRENVIHYRASATRLIGEATDSDLFWSVRGKNISPSTAGDLSRFGESVWLVTGDAGWLLHRERFSLQSTVGARFFRGHPVVHQNIRFVRPAFEVTDWQVSEVSGVLVAALLEASWKGKFLSHDATYSLLQPAGGRAFRDAFGPIARHTGRWSTVADVSSSFQFSVTAWVQSETSWPDYASSVEVAGSPYRARLKSFSRVDAVATKGFWRNRFTFSVSMRNLFGSEVVLHPIGALLDRALIVRFTMNLE